MQRDPAELRRVHQTHTRHRILRLARETLRPARAHRHPSSASRLTVFWVHGCRGGEQQVVDEGGYGGPDDGDIRVRYRRDSFGVAEARHEDGYVQLDGRVEGGGGDFHQHGCEPFDRSWSPRQPLDEE